MQLTNKFVIIVPTYNAKDYIEECLLSILSQDFDDLGVIIRDDMSTDGTHEVILNLLNLKFRETPDSFEIATHFNDKDVIFVRNSKKLYPIGNTYESVISYVANEDAIIGVVDGDDRLAKSTAVKTIYKAYQGTDKWMIWSQHASSSGRAGQSGPLPPDSVIYNGRQYWSVTHFRTSKARLFHKLNSKDLKDPFVDSQYYTFSGDAAFLFPFCEMCGNDKSLFLNEILYIYNDNLPSNEHHKDVSNAIKYGNHIRNHGTRYKKLASLYEKQPDNIL